MVTETELKLRLAPEWLARLKRQLLLRAAQTSRPVSRRLYNIYYDTPQHDLHKSGMALRLRRVGRQWLQTLKGGGSVRAGLHQRNEWEVPVKGMALDFSLLESGAQQTAEWDDHLPKALRKKLQPVFVTDFVRSSRMLLWQGAEIELCADEGTVSTRRYGMPVCEVELELKSGEPRQLFELALAILDVAPFELEQVSKAEQGYRLLTGYTASPVKGTVPEIGRPEIGREDALGDVLQRLIWSCLQHFQGNLRGAMEGGDAEYLHQLRVALRRLRVVLSMAEKRRSDQQLASLSKEVAVLGNALGRAREWDAFIEQAVQPAREHMPRHAGLKALLAAARQRRDACYDELRSEERTREIQRLLLRFAIWMNGQYWKERQFKTPARDFAASRLDKLAKRFARAAQHLEPRDSERLHALRILAKKLRYSAEFFAGLYGGQKRAKSFIGALSELQDVLGQINDAAVSQRLLDELAESELSAHQDAVVLVKEVVARELSVQFTVLRKAVRRFGREQSFWEK